MSIPLVTPTLGGPSEAPRPAHVGTAVQPGTRRAVEVAPIRVPPKPQYDPVKLRDNMRQAIEELNRQMKDSGRSLRFSMDDTLNMPVVTVKNANTGEVVRQIPSETMIHVAHTLEALKGLMHDGST